MITQLTQLGQTDSVEALAACTADPPACANFSKVLADLTSATPNRRVLDLISGAMAQGSQNGTNPFYASPFAVDIMRLHADADPDAASDLLIQATEALLADPTTANASQGKDGFFAHAIDGLVARTFTTIPTPPDVRTRIVRLLQTLAASTTLPDTVQRARTALGLIQPASTPAPVPTPSQPAVATAPSAAPLVVTVPTPAKPPLSRAMKIVLLVGFSVVAIASVAIVISARSPNGYFGKVFRRRS